MKRYSLVCKEVARMQREVWKGIGGGGGGVLGCNGCNPCLPGGAEEGSRQQQTCAASATQSQQPQATHTSRGAEIVRFTVYISTEPSPKIEAGLWPFDIVVSLVSQQRQETALSATPITELPTLRVSPCDTRFCMFSHALAPHIQFLSQKN